MSENEKPMPPTIEDRVAKLEKQVADLIQNMRMITQLDAKLDLFSRHSHVDGKVVVPIVNDRRS